MEEPLSLEDPPGLLTCLQHSPPSHDSETAPSSASTPANNSPHDEESEDANELETGSFSQVIRNQDDIERDVAEQVDGPSSL